jgi:beta-glucosidase
VRCNQSSFDEAVQMAKQAQVVVVTLGLRFDNFCDGGWANHKGDDSCEAEAWDRTTLELPGNQTGLVAALRAAMSPEARLIGLLVHGGTLALGNTLNLLDAVVTVWYPGLMGAKATASVVFGERSPAGRTAVTWYQRTADLGPMGEMDPYAGNGTTYRFFKGTPEFPFGFGLSYTTFSYSNLSVSNPLVTACEVVTVQVAVRNTGTVDSDEVAQVYAKQPDATVPVPRIRLVAFERVHIKAGQEQIVSFSIQPSRHIAVRDSKDIYHGEVWIEKGRLELYVGGGQPDYAAGVLSTTVVVADDRALSSCMQK